MTKYEDYKPLVSDKLLAEGVHYRAMVWDDIGAIARISAEREGTDVGTHVERISAEFTRETGADERQLLIAVKESEVIGFGRIRKVGPDESSRAYPSPEGWYLLGLIVCGQYRRMGVGRALSLARFDWLRSRGVSQVFSFFSAENRTSIDFHKSLGFDVVQEGSGFLHVGFDCGKGYLARKRL